MFDDPRRTLQRTLSAIFVIAALGTVLALVVDDVRGAPDQLVGIGIDATLPAPTDPTEPPTPTEPAVEVRDTVAAPRRTLPSTPVTEVASLAPVPAPTAAPPTTARPKTTTAPVVPVATAAALAATTTAATAASSTVPATEPATTTTSVPPTTVAPTTAAPTTVAPTTVAPTTTPTTLAPTTTLCDPDRNGGRRCRNNND